MIVTLMVIALVAALAATVTTVTINNLQASQLSREAGVAVNAADAGVAEAVSYLRANGVRGLCARPTVYDPLAPNFDKAFNLATQTCVSGPSMGTRVPGQPYAVLIVTDAAYPASELGRYLIYSRGVGAGDAAKVVSAEVEVKGVGVPKSGFFGHAVAASGNNLDVRQSIFSTGCVYFRSKLDMSGIDAYGLPVAIHSSQIVTDDNGTSPNCATSSKAIHQSSPCYAPAGHVSNGAFDQDVLGGSLEGAAGAGCRTARTLYPGISADTWAKYYPNGSKIADRADLLRLFDIKDPALTQAEIDQLRFVAKFQGNYKTAASASDSFTPNGRQAVLFYDLNGGKVDLGTIRGFKPPGGGACVTRSLVVVISGADAVFPTGDALAASVFVVTPGKSYTANGGNLVGTVFADLINLGGNTAVSQLDQQCYVDNPSPSLLTFTVTSYREIDG
jgi:hypothetical protein